MRGGLGFEIAGFGGSAVAVHCGALFGRFEMALRIEVAELEEGGGDPHPPPDGSMRRRQ
jgi:hypothetical protein